VLALQKHYAALQAMALEREELEAVPDYVVPDEEGMEKYADVIKEFNAAVFPIGYIPSTKKQKAPKKEKTEEGEKVPKAKKPAPTAAEVSQAIKLNKVQMELCEFYVRHMSSFISDFNEITEKQHYIVKEKISVMLLCSYHKSAHMTFLSFIFTNNV
jgi:hypothetical protein